MNIFVTGVTGFIGNVFLRDLLRRLSASDRVVALVRAPFPVEDRRLSLHVGTLAAVDAFAEPLRQADYVFHLAANAVYGSGANYRAVNTAPTRRMLEILQAGGRCKNFIFVSTIGAVDRCPGDRCARPLDRNSKPCPRSEYGRSKLEAEKIVRESGIPFTIVRPTWVYGRGMRENSHLNALATKVKRSGLLSRLGFPGKVSVIHVDDLVSGLLGIMGNPEAIGKTYFAGSENLSLGEILGTLFQKIHGSEVAQFGIPRFRFFMSRIHSLLPLAISNLFLDYLSAEDESFFEDLGVKERKQFGQGVQEILETNAAVSGRWLITGAGSGIGKALARLLQARGERLILVDKDAAGMAEFVEAVRIEADLSSPEGLEAVRTAAAEVPIAVWVNNAGVGFRKTIETITDEELNLILKVNVEAPLRLVRESLPHLRRCGTSIVNIGSNIAFNPLPEMSLYSASKAFLVNWSESLTEELRETNSVLTFSPSGTLTQFQKRSGVKILKEGKGLLRAEDVAGAIVRSVERRKNVVLFGWKSNILLWFCRFLPREWNIRFWGRMFSKIR